MYIHPEDFGQGPVTLLGNDVLFLDSNVLVAFLDEGHIFHRSAYTFLTCLTLKRVLQRYGLKEFLVSYLGADKFYDKYGYIPKLGG